ncbi:MAG: TAXI family TRAP transporter solute-binding subunit [Parvibaculum sp.]
MNRLRLQAHALWQRIDGLLSHEAARPILLGLAGLVVAGLAMLIYLRPSAVLEEEPEKVVFFQIGSGSSGGTEFAVGERLAAAISRPPDTPPCESNGPCGVAGLVAVVKSSQSDAASIRAVNARHFEAAIVSASSLEMAKRGTGPFRGEKPYRNIRAISRLYHQTIHVLASRGLNAHSITDLKGKRVAIGPRGSIQRQDALAILKAYGLGTHNMVLVDEDRDRAIELVISNRLDAFFLVGADPVPELQDLIGRGVLDLLSVDGEPAQKLSADDSRFEVAHLPENTYGFAPALDTLAVSTVLICNEQADADVIYGVTRALFYAGNKPLLASGQSLPGFLPAEQMASAAAASADLATPLLAHLPIPVHAGAQRYYREAGVLAPETP